MHLAYSNQIAQYRGAITGGLICAAACVVSQGYSPVDHDQRYTLNVGYKATLRGRVYGGFNVYYGSGFTNGYTAPPSPFTGNYLQVHTTADLTVGKQFGEKYTVAVNVRGQYPGAAG